MSSIAYSYKELIDSFRNFKKVDREGVNKYDSPSYLYFKPFFYFTDDYGLLGINGINFTEESEFEKNSKNFVFTDTDSIEDKNDIRKNEFPDTAFSFLCINSELERVQLIKKFILLLSDISINSPWYFKSIGGLDSALERKMFDKDFKIEEERKSITIECLEDAYDQRIGTLLDLYRAICYSYQNKNEILPANLRKFNMGILLFNAPIRNRGGKSGSSNSAIKIPEQNEDIFITNTKLIELRNCEIDYNSGKTAYGTLTTEEPLQPKYTITIYFDDAYESRYNEILQGVVSDFISYDISSERDEKNYLLNVNAHGKAPNDDLMKLKHDKLDTTNYKDYWVETDYTNDPYYFEFEKNTLETRKEDIETKDIFGHAWETVKEGVVNKWKEQIEVPDFNFNNNIHDAGKVSMYGKYEYLNRMSGSNSMLGNLLTTTVGQAWKLSTEPLKQLYLGNIHNLRASRVVDMGKKLISGDYVGLGVDIYNAVENSKNNEEETSINGKTIYPNREQYVKYEAVDDNKDTEVRSINVKPKQKNLGTESWNEYKKDITYTQLRTVDKEPPEGKTIYPGREQYVKYEAVDDGKDTEIRKIYDTSLSKRKIYKQPKRISKIAKINQAKSIYNSL